VRVLEIARRQGEHRFTWENVQGTAGRRVPPEGIPTREISDLRRQRSMRSRRRLPQLFFPYQVEVW